ncbi:MAG: hypothetical protein IJE84_00775 [Clostridia bacterium]|nr:hypothetical protein [Clostridia bacterium]
MIDISTIIWTCAIFGVIILVTIIGVSDHTKRKKQLEYELEHPQSPLEYEFHVKITDLKCTILTSENIKRPAAEKCFLVYYEKLDSDFDEEDKIGCTSVDQETYDSLKIGTTGHLAFTNDIFFGFTKDEEV